MRTFQQITVRFGAWLRDNAEQRSATARDQVMVAQRRGFEQFFAEAGDRSGTLAINDYGAAHDNAQIQAPIATSRGRTPMMFITRVRL